VFLVGCAASAPEERRPPPPVVTHKPVEHPHEHEEKLERGMGSWYGGGDGLNGSKTANGERYDQNAFTAAHRTLPFGTKVKVTNVKNGRTVIVRINDRGPFGRGRVIDVSRAAARVLQMIDDGVVPVTLQVVER
jgi:rare lipoprotein A